MRTLADIDTLVGRLVVLLQQGGPSASDRDYAEQYGDYCASVNERLSQCARMIDEGSSMQALMLAEEKPNLLDVVAVLSFAKSTEWHEACRLNGLRLAARIDRSAVHKVNELYTKGNRSEQTKALYKRFRAAMATKDNVAALATISAIAGLDPTDADAGKELDRLQRKRCEDSLKSLRDALSNNDEAVVLSLLEDCQKLGITDAPEIGSALNVHHRVFAEKAKQEVAGIIPTLANLQTQGRWQQCGERASRVTSLESTYGLSLSAAESAAVASAANYFESCRQQAMYKVRFNEAVVALSDCTDRIQRNEKTSARKSSDTIEEERLQLKKAYQKTKDFALPLNEKLVERVGQVASNLDSEIERLKRARKVRNLAVGTALVLSLTFLGVGGYFFFDASQHASQIRTLVSDRKAQPLRDLIREVEGRSSAQLSVPSLKSALLEAKAWLEGVSAQESAAETAVAKALELAAAEFSDKRPEEASAVFRQATEAIDKLPSDLAGRVKSRLTEAEGKLTIWLGAMRDGRVGAAKKRIEEARGFLANIDAADNVENLKLAFGPAAAVVESLLEAAGSQVEQMKLPTAMEAEISDMTARVERTADALRAYEAALSALSSAKTTEDYASGVEQMSQVELPRLPEIRAAQLMAIKKMDAHQLLGIMLLPSAPEVWVPIKERPADLEKAPQPTVPRKPELDRLRDLINNENLVGIYEATIQDYDQSSKRKIFAQSKLNVSEHGESITSSSGKVYDPALSSNQVKFQDQVFAHIGTQTGKRVVEQKESDAWRFMQELELKQLLKESKYNEDVNILAVMDKVAASRDAPALVKAFVLQELAAVAKARTNEWGLAWVPFLDADLEQIRKLAGGKIESGDWMIPGKSSTNQKLASWFKERGELSYFAQQTMNMKLAKSALEAGLVICGYVGADGKFVETNKASRRNADILWGLDASNGQPVAIFERFGDSPEAEFFPKRDALPLSPVFALPIDRNEAVAAALKAANVSGDLVNVYASGLPPLFVLQTDESQSNRQ